MDLRLILAACAAMLFGLAPRARAAAPQSIKPGNAFYTNEQHGFRFKPPADYPGIPLQPGESDLGFVARMAGPKVMVLDGSTSNPVLCELLVFASADVAVAEAAPGRTAAKERRADVTQFLQYAFGRADKSVWDKPEADSSVKVGKLSARHRIWKMGLGQNAVVVDGWTFPMDQIDVSLVFTAPEEKRDKFLDVFERSAKSFQPVERKAAAEAAKGNSYEDQLSRAAADAASTPGGKWHAVPTPSKKFILKTSSDNKKFLDEVITRLEKSRELYERDFPPKQGMNHVSVVRVCGSAEEFHAYGKTGGGVAGWFNPGTTELVLYDALEVDRNMTFAVMSHEAFHQYCFFLFDRSEAHRWFDEGQGDYYGGARFKGGRAEITPHMPGGLDRLGVIREMIQASTYKPLVEHLNFDHASWQSQGPSNVSCYAQSWSIIYMLREGALGAIRNNKVWMKEYADIIPHYVETLYAGFQKAYEDLRRPVLARAAKEGREPTADELDSVNVPESRKKEIWKAAMDASWGQIDLDEFEKRWILYVQKELK